MSNVTGFYFADLVPREDVGAAEGGVAHAVQRRPSGRPGTLPRSKVTSAGMRRVFCQSTRWSQMKLTQNIVLKALFVEV